MPPKRKPGKSGTAASRHAVGAQCGAKKKTGGHCTLGAGWGTSHPGIGKCKMHGGNTPTHILNAAGQEYEILLGRPLNINPYEALLTCIRITAGEVDWLSNAMANLDKQAWVEDTIVGKQFHLYARERAKRTADLARYSQMAISLGIAERAVKLAETYGEMLAQLIQGILGDLDLTEDQRAKVPSVVQRHLIAIDGGRDNSEVLELTA